MWPPDDVNDDNDDRVDGDAAADTDAVDTDIDAVDDDEDNDDDDDDDAVKWPSKPRNASTPLRRSLKSISEL